MPAARPPRPPRPPALPLALLAAALHLCAGGYVPPTKYLIVSNARNGTIGYVQLARGGAAAGPVRTLIDRDLIHPQGLAVDQKRQLLLVADSDLKKVVSYGLSVLPDGGLAVDEQVPVAEGVESRWVAVDGLGNVYLTDEDQGQVLKVSAGQVLEGDTRPRALAPGGAALRAPGGVATDNFHVFWTNKESGESVGTVMKALHSAPKGRAADGGGGGLKDAAALAKNLPKAYGVCLALDDVFFTGADKSVFVVRQARRLGANGTQPKAAEEAVEVTSKLANPRGCAWDGESTVFVADRSADAVFALPGPLGSLLQADAQKIMDFDGAFGVAVFSGGQRAALPAALALALAWAWAARLMT